MNVRERSKRLAAWEADRAIVTSQPTPEEAAEAARQYAATLDEPEELDPRAVAYWATATLHQISSDYDAMLKGAPAPWA
ncbi:hypothetical protein MKL09_16770 [Methylobacterium sp. J-048]|uniref:hypothetical protein n=1 Tax=Methylobacterium sp. J-048 TaxID=2836635 RepID=UPI001FB8B40E|nr:hypothetical protein [Methylobacterium sp. J-048]MCJ2058199.1 hypothetical protein [Methylobacterium sp. J-048]